MLELGLHHLSYLLGRQRLDSSPSLRDCAQTPTKFLPVRSSGKNSSPTSASLRHHSLSADLNWVPLPEDDLTGDGPASSDSDLARSLSDTTSTLSIPADQVFSLASSDSCYLTRSNLLSETSIPDPEDLVFQHESERTDFTSQRRQSDRIVVRIVSNQLGEKKGRIMKPIRLRKRKSEKQHRRPRTDPIEA